MESFPYLGYLFPGKKISIFLLRIVQQNEYVESIADCRQWSYWSSIFNRLSSQLTFSVPYVYTGYFWILANDLELTPTLEMRS